VTSFFGIKVCVFLENGTTDLRQFFFSGCRRKQLFITTCIEKHCTRPYKSVTNKRIPGIKGNKSCSVLFSKDLSKSTFCRLYHNCWNRPILDSSVHGLDHTESGILKIWKHTSQIRTLYAHCPLNTRISRTLAWMNVWPKTHWNVFSLALTWFLTLTLTQKHKRFLEKRNDVIFRTTVNINYD